MFENKEIRTEIVDRTDEDYQNRVCPKCMSRKRHRLNSYIREISDLGSIHIRKVLKFESVTFKCLNCGANYLVEIEEAIKGHQHSKNVIEVAMKFMIDENLSAEKTSKFLESLYNIEVSRGTIHQWFNKFKSEYLKHHSLVDLKNLEEYSGYITIDGNHSPLDNKKNKKSRTKGKNKKKLLSLFLTPTGNGNYTCRLGKAKIPTKLKKLYGI